MFLAFSGDIVQAGSRADLYDAFFAQFDEELNRIGISKQQRICVPGNHDISQESVSKALEVHEALVNQKLEECQFNDYVVKPNCHFVEKFSNYVAFESKFAKYGIAGAGFTGRGWCLNEDIAVYCLNSAVCSSGGLNGLQDYQRLSVDTRSLQRWILDCKVNTKILMMHHSMDCLTDWSSVALQKILRNDFSLCLSGHVHDQSVFHTLQNNSALVQCSAPPLLTNKKEKLGYSIIAIDRTGVIEIKYRQWTPRHRFVSGVDFSDTDDGRIVVTKGLRQGSVDNVTDQLTENLNEALHSFSSQPIIWAEPVISKTNDRSRLTGDGSNTLVKATELAKNPTSVFIKAPPQFGLTCLAHFLIKEAWTQHSSRWLLLDASVIKIHTIEKVVRKKLSSEAIVKSDIRCVVLDSWTNNEKDSSKVVQWLCVHFAEIPIIVMQTIDDSAFKLAHAVDEFGRDFSVLYLLALTRGKLRRVISEYNRAHHIGEEDAVLAKVSMDLETLNIHRTPLNCITLLKVAERYFDESPVNRTKMLEMVLFLLFNMDGVPVYKSRPDLKDCEYVLGRFCEKMIRTDCYEFSQQEFTKELNAFCAEKLIHLEIDAVFSILFSNSIIVKWAGYYRFRFSYWIFYFAAQRMHADKAFSDYIFAEKKYVSCPEIIEFYTGIDRSRTDALQLLTQDLRASCNAIQGQIGLPENMDPYRGTKWALPEQSLIMLKNEIREGVSKSNLPDAVKDGFADKGYDQFRPYDQTIYRISDEQALTVLMQNIKASSRALRNSDYADPDAKRALLHEIIRGWELVTQVLFVLTPILAVTGHGEFAGQSFGTDGYFGDTIEQRLAMIWSSLPYNIIRFSENDIFSPKIGPLLFDYLGKKISEIKRHELIILLIRKRPQEWSKHMREYIEKMPKDSFYLNDVLDMLRGEYQYSYASPSELLEIAYLIKMVLAKHFVGHNKPGPEHVVKIPNTNLPKRESDEDLV